MTEEQWLSCTDPTPMLEFLRGKASDRKLRLFAVGCCRRIWQLFQDKPCRTAVDVAERYADGNATQKDMEEAANPLRWIARATNRSAAPLYSTWGTWDGMSPCKYIHDAVCSSAKFAARAKGGGKGRRRQQAILLRCVFGNPFRPSPRLDAAWLAWHDGTVKKLVEAIYEQRKFEDMPLLADALEDAGCTDKDILAHGREQGAAHVRGCWVIDLLLGKS